MIVGFWTGLLIKAALTAFVVVAASVLAERAGPYVAGVIAAFPVSTGPAYALLALEHDSGFIAQSALDSFVGNAAAAIFTVAYVLLAERLRLAVRLAVCTLVWLVAAGAIHSVQWTAFGAAMVVILVFAPCIAFARRVKLGMPRPRRARRWYDLPGRALLVGGVVGTVVSVSHAIGPSATGIATVFPINISSMAIVVELRLGATMSAATVASAMRAMPGVTAAYLVLHLTAMQLGTWAGLAIWLLVCMAWSGGLLLASRRSAPLPGTVKP